MQQHPFEQFLQVFVPEVRRKTQELFEALWLLETTGSQEAAQKRAQIDGELRLLYNDRAAYEKLLQWDKEVFDPILKRQLNVLIRTFKSNMIPKALLEEIVKTEAALALSYANFRPKIDGKEVSENEIGDLLKNENNPEVRKSVWAASKEIGEILAPQILHLVQLRNKAAHSVGYDNYFQMQLDLQEVDAKWLDKTFDELAHQSDGAYTEILRSIREEHAQRFGTQEWGPWAWGDPFCQEDPLAQRDLDLLVEGVDITAASQAFFKRMGIDVQSILQRSDLYERAGKNQHAFCINVDRYADVRVLTNLDNSIKWLETMLHELGHGVYELGFDPQLPWLLREPPHMIPTEAMALIAGRQAYRYAPLRHLVGDRHEQTMRKADMSLKRRQLIFSRWVLVMTFFEEQLYQNPHQDLNRLWWETVEKYQKIPMPENREGKNDWAAKYHIGLAPVYYFSYLLGEMFASAIEEKLVQVQGSSTLDTKPAGDFLQQKLFHPGNRLRWDELVAEVIDEPLTPASWVRQFAN